MGNTLHPNSALGHYNRKTSRSFSISKRRQVSSKSTTSRPNLIPRPIHTRQKSSSTTTRPPHYDVQKQQITIANLKKALKESKVNEERLKRNMIELQAENEKFVSTKNKYYRIKVKILIANI